MPYTKKIIYFDFSYKQPPGALLIIDNKMSTVLNMQYDIYIKIYQNFANILQILLVLKFDTFWRS